MSKFPQSIARVFTKYTPMTKSRIEAAFAYTKKKYKKFSDVAASDKFKKLPRLLFMPKSTHVCQQKSYPPRDPVPLRKEDVQFQRTLHTMQLSQRRNAFSWPLWQLSEFYCT
jgi:hypothetical protein